MSKAVVNRNGRCPYCNKALFSEENYITIRPNHIKMKCEICNKWSVNKSPQGYQYPLQNPLDMESVMTTVTEY